MRISRFKSLISDCLTRATPDLGPLGSGAPMREFWRFPPRLSATALLRVGRVRVICFFVAWALGFGFFGNCQSGGSRSLPTPRLILCSYHLGRSTKCLWKPPSCQDPSKMEANLDPPNLQKSIFEAQLGLHFGRGLGGHAAPQNIFFGGPRAFPKSPQK